MTGREKSIKDRQSYRSKYGNSKKKYAKDYKKAVLRGTSATEVRKKKEAKKADKKAKRAAAKAKANSPAAKLAAKKKAVAARRAKNSSGLSRWFGYTK